MATVVKGKVPVPYRDKDGRTTIVYMSETAARSVGYGPNGPIVPKGRQSEGYRFPSAGNNETYSLATSLRRR